MSTRSVTMVVHRSAAEKYKAGFAIHPNEVSDSSYVNMYLHHDGYPQWQAIQLVNWVKHMKAQGYTSFGDGSRIAAHLVKDMHYNSQYLYPSVKGIDHQYTYIIWVGKPDVWISCYDNYGDKCVFVNKLDDIAHKYHTENLAYDVYKTNTNKPG